MASALDVIGLDDVAEIVYEALLTSGPAGLPELITNTGLPRWRVQGAIRRLEVTGLASRTSERARFMAIDPAIALDVLLLDQVERLNGARARARELTERFQQELSRQDPTELVEVVTGRDAVRQRSDQVQRSTRHRLRMLDKPPYAGETGSVNDAEINLLDRGGEAKLIYQRSSLEITGRLAQVEQEAAAGEQARTLSALPTKLLLVDDRLAVVPLQAEPAEIDSIVIVHPSALLEALSALFDTLWTIATPLTLTSTDRTDRTDRMDRTDRTGDIGGTGGTGGTCGEPDLEDRRLLALLTAGLADEAISRQLGVSYRTLQRRIHALMDRLHVQTRFQLGVQATLRSWIGG